MHLIRFDHPLSWGELDLPLLGITHDWEKKPLKSPATYSLAIDPERFWFVAGHSQPATIHPNARPGQFLAELWKYDVAEIFIENPATGRYLELNLAPNGGWWSAEFTAPRVRAYPEDEPFPGVQTYADLAPDGSWVAAITLPLEPMRERIDFGPNSKANVSFILETPNQRFITATDLGQKEIDFHWPAAFPTVQIHDGGLPGSKESS
ncbi:MAG: hypothetical protein ACPG4K_02115 [Haloferula sp.]